MGLRSQICLLLFRLLQKALQLSAIHLGQGTSMLSQSSLVKRSVTSCQLYAHGEARGRPKSALALAHLRQFRVSLVCLGKTKDGSPRHPSYVRADQPLIPLL